MLHLSLSVVESVITYTWFFLMLFLAWRIWRNGIILQETQKILIDAAVKRAEMSAEASQRSALAAEKSAETTFSLASVLEAKMEEKTTTRTTKAVERKL